MYWQFCQSLSHAAQIGASHLIPPNAGSFVSHVLLCMQSTTPVQPCSICSSDVIYFVDHCKDVGIISAAALTGTFIALVSLVRLTNLSMSFVIPYPTLIPLLLCYLCIVLWFIQNYQTAPEFGIPI